MSPLQPFEVGVWHRWTLVKMTTARAKGGWAASTLFRRNRSNGLQFYLKRPFMCLHDICEPIMKMWVHGRRLRQRAHTLKALCIIMNKVGTIDRSMSQWGLNMHQSVHQGPQICLLCGQMDAKMYWNGTNRWTWPHRMSYRSPYDRRFSDSMGPWMGDLAHLPYLRILTILVLGIHNLRVLALWFISKHS